jgi:hypothetical protein
VKEFFIGGLDGGAGETVALTVIRPDGEIAWAHDGNMSRGEMYPVAVPPGMAGKIWKLQVVSVDDYSLILGDGVSQLVSTSPAAVVND